MHYIFTYVLNTSGWQTLNVQAVINKHCAANNKCRFVCIGQLNGRYIWKFMSS